MVFISHLNLFTFIEQIRERVGKCQRKWFWPSLWALQSETVRCESLSLSSEKKRNAEWRRRQKKEEKSETGPLWNCKLVFLWNLAEDEVFVSLIKLLKRLMIPACNCIWFIVCGGEI